MTDYPAARPRQPRRAGAAADPGRPGRRRPSSTRPRPATCGNGPTSRSSTSPCADVGDGALGRRGRQPRRRPAATSALHGIRVGDVHRRHAAKVLGTSTVEGLDDTVRFEWSAFDAWFEEDEQVFVHPGTRTRGSMRSARPVRVRVEFNGDRPGRVLLARPVFETGLPTRYYLNRTDVDFTHLVPSDTVTSCPYKGTTSGYWSADSSTATASGHRLDLRLPHPRRASHRRARSPSTTRSSTSSSTASSSSDPGPTSRPAERARRVSSTGRARHAQSDHGDDVALDLVRPTAEGEDGLAPGLVLEPAPQDGPR